MSEITVSSIPIINIVLFFLVYLGIHIFIGLQEKKYRTSLGLPEKPKDAKSVIKQLGVAEFEKDDLEKYKVYSFLMQWFPAFYIIIILIILYGF